jgi:WD40 repeat protein
VILLLSCTSEKISEKDLLSYTAEMQDVDTDWAKTFFFGLLTVNLQSNISSMFGGAFGDYEYDRGWVAIYTVTDLEEIRDVAREIEPPGNMGELHADYLEGMENFIETLYRSIDEPDITIDEYDEALSQSSQLMLALQEALDLNFYEPDEDLLASEEFNTFGEDWNSELSERLEENYQNQEAIEFDYKEPIDIWVAFNQTGEQMGMASSDDIYILDAVSGEIVDELTNLDAVVEGMNCYPVYFTPSGDGVSCNDFEGSLLIWNFEGGYQILDICSDCSIGKTNFSPDGNRLAIGARVDEENVALVFDLASGERILTLKGHSDPRPFASYSPDGGFILTITDRDPCRIWDANTGDLVWTLGEEWGIDCVFNPDGSLIATGGIDGFAHVWDMTTEKEILNVEAYVGGEDADPHYDGRDGSPIYEVSKVAFSPNGHQLATADGDSNVRVWDYESGEMLFEHNIVRPGDRVTHIIKVAFSPDGRYLLTQEQYGDSYLWNNESGEMAVNLGPVNSSNFDPDGHSVVVGRDDGTISVLDIESNEEILMIEFPNQ